MTMVRSEGAGRGQEQKKVGARKKKGGRSKKNFKAQKSMLATLREKPKVTKVRAKKKIV